MLGRTLTRPGVRPGTQTADPQIVSIQVERGGSYVEQNDDLDDDDDISRCPGYRPGLEHAPACKAHIGDRAKSLALGTSLTVRGKCSTLERFPPAHSKNGNDGT